MQRLEKLPYQDYNKAYFRIKMAVLEARKAYLGIRVSRIVDNRPTGLIGIKKDTL